MKKIRSYDEMLRAIKEKLPAEVNRVRNQCPTSERVYGKSPNETGDRLVLEVYKDLWHTTAQADGYEHNEKTAAFDRETIRRIKRERPDIFRWEGRPAQAEQLYDWYSFFEPFHSVYHSHNAEEDPVPAAISGPQRRFESALHRDLYCLQVHCICDLWRREPVNWTQDVRAEIKL